MSDVHGSTEREDGRARRAPRERNDRTEHDDRGERIERSERDVRREPTDEQIRDRLRRRAVFLRELAEARELRRRVTPRRSRHAQAKAAVRKNTFRAP